LAVDLNHDGFPDVAVGGSEGLSVLLAQADGSLGPEARHLAGRTVSALTAGDFDGDGHTDLALGLATSPTTVLLMVGDGIGSFALGDSIVGSGGQIFSMRTSDIDLDGHLDLVIATGGSSQGRVLTSLGNGNGTFQPAHLMSIISSAAPQLVVALVDGDLLPDIIVSDYPSRIDVFLGAGGGLFTGPLITSHKPASPGSIAFGDIDADGIGDIAVGSGVFPDPRGLAVLHGNGDGTFGAKTVIPCTSQPSGIALADLDGNGWLDAVAGDPDSGSVMIFDGSGDGLLRAPRAVVTGGDWPFDKSPLDVEVSDFDQNGAMDLLAVNHVSDCVSIHLNRGHGAFGAPVALTAAGSPSSPYAGDFNGDGHGDLLITHFNGTLSYFFGGADGSLGPRLDVPDSHGPFSLFVGQFDASGPKDFAALNHDSTLSIYLGQAGVPVLAHNYPLGFGAPDFEGADMNGDGVLDLVLAGGAAKKLVVRLGLGDGSLGPPIETATPSGPTALAVGEVDQDATADIVYAIGNGNLFFCRGNGDGTFQPQVALPGNLNSTKLLLADFNEDSKSDLVTGGSPSPVPYSYVALGQGDGTFLPWTPLIIPPDQTGLAAADVDLDGHLDLVSVGARANAIAVFRGRGDGSFDVRQDYGTLPSPVGVAIADLDGDAYPDLATTHLQENKITLLPDVQSLVSVPSLERRANVSLGLIHPNPSVGRFVIPFALPWSGGASLRIFDVTGRLVKTILDAPTPAGLGTATWDGRSEDGAATAPGMYFCELRQGRLKASARLVVVQ